MAIESIAKTLGSGSGVDVGALVTGLVEASFANKTAQLTAKTEALTAKVSKLAELKSGISDFAAALRQLTSSGALATQPTSSNPAILAVTKLPGASTSGLTATVEVRQLAQGQVASSPAFSDGRTHPLSAGTLTLTFGAATVAGDAMTDFVAGPGAPVTIDIDAAHATLEGVAKAINATPGANVTASIVTDSDGARLVLKSATGASQGFELKGTGALSALDIGRDAADSSINAAAQDALVAVDGVPTRYPTNSISSLVPGVRLDLVSAVPGTKVAIGSKQPTTELNQSVTNFVETFNEIYNMAKAAVDPANGPLRGDSAAQNLVRGLKAMTLTTLLPGATGGRPGTLADIGVATQRDGTLRIDSARLSKVLSSFPADVEAIFAQGAGLTKALDAIATRAVSKETGLGASEATYAKAQSRVADDKDEILAATEKMRTRMTQQFAAMDAKVAAYKSTQSFLEQQIKAWNAND